MILNLSKIIFLFLLTFHWSVYASPLKEIKIAIPVADGYPYIKKNINRETKNPGTYVEFLRTLERKMNIRIEIVRYPWKRCLSFLEKGEIDGVISASYKKEREKIGVYPMRDGRPDPSRRFESGDYYLFVQKGSNTHWDGERFTHLDGVVNVQLGFSIVDFLQKRKITVNEVATPQKAFELLSSGHGKAAAVHSIIGNVLLEKYKNLRRIETPLVSKPYYLLMSHQIYNKSPMFVEKLWDKVGEIFFSPKLETINKRYLAMDKW